MAGLSVATSTASSIGKLNPAIVTFVATGVRAKGGGEEDVACADYIASLLLKAPLDTTEIQNRVLESGAATKFTQSDESDFPESDLKLALKIDRFKFAMKVSRRDDHLVLKTIDGIQSSVSA